MMILEMIYFNRIILQHGLKIPPRTHSKCIVCGWKADNQTCVMPKEARIGVFVDQFILIPAGMSQNHCFFQLKLVKIVGCLIT